MIQKTPAAFVSYVHSDDKYGHLTTLRERLSDEVQVQIGIEFPIFQDRKDIQWGQNWRQRIENSLDEVTFLIPIITPSFFNSKACRDELERFVEREKKLKRNDLILPVYFVDTPLLNDAELRATDELAEVIATRQWADWRELRFEPFTNPQVGKNLAQLAVQVRNALPHLTRTKRTATRTLATSKPTATTGEAGEQPAEGPTAKKGPPTRVVDPMHRGDFATITEAINAVDPGTRILVRPGLYEEGLVIDKPLEIIGDGERDEIVIQTAGRYVVQFQTTMGRVVNFTLRQRGGGKWYCVDIPQGRLELEDCDITSESLACVGIHSGADPRLRRNRIHNSKGGCGVLVCENAQGTLEDNDIFGNALAGVEIRTMGSPTLRRNRIHNGKQGGVFVHDGGQGTIEDNDIFGNGEAGLETKTAGSPMARNNRVNKNALYGVWVYENGGGTFENNDLTENVKGPWSITADSEANVTRINNKE